MEFLQSRANHQPDKAPDARPVDRGNLWSGPSEWGRVRGGLADDPAIHREPDACRPALTGPGVHRHKNGGTVAARPVLKFWCKPPCRRQTAIGPQGRGPFLLAYGSKSDTRGDQNLGHSSS